MINVDGVRDVMRSSDAGGEAARASSGERGLQRPSRLTGREAYENYTEIGEREVEDADPAGMSVGGTARGDATVTQWLNHADAPSIGRRHGLFDEV